MQIIGLPITALTILFGAWRFLDQRKQVLAEQRFEHYHRTVQRLIGAEPEQKLRIDEQLALVFELRRYPEYRDVSFRILSHLRAEWSPAEANAVLIREIDHTLSYLKGSKLDRYFKRLHAAWGRYDAADVQ